MTTENQRLRVELEATLTRFEREMKRAVQTGTVTATALERRFDTMQAAMGRSSARAATGLSNVVQISGAGRFVLQNTANQIGDIAVQLGSGTSASRALGQQLPQLLGGFGALGGTLGIVAPLLGTIAALGIPLAAAFISSRGGAVSADDAIKAYGKSLADLQELTKLSGSSLDELREKFGSQAEEVRGAIALLREFALVEALDDLRAAASAVDSDFSRLFARLEQADQELAPFGMMSMALDDLNREFGLTADQAYRVKDALDAFGRASGPEDQVAAAREINALLIAIFGSADKIPPRLKAMAQALAESDVRASEFIATMEGAGGVVGGVADEAARIAENLGISLGLAKQIASFGPQGFGAPKGGRGGDPRTMGGSMLDWQVRDADAFLRDWKPPKASRGGGGGGRSSAESADMRAAQRMFQDTRTEAERYAAEVERINELHARFPEIITDEVRDRALAALKGGLGEIGDLSKQIETNLADMFTQIVTGSMSAKDAVQQLLGQLSKMLLNRAFNDIFKNLGFNLFGGVTANANGNVISAGRVVPFASGGVVTRPTTFPMRGGTGLMGEAGPEAIIPLARIGGKLGVASKGGGNTQVVVQNMTGQPSRVERERGPDGKSLVKVIVGEGLARGEFDGALKGRTGIQPKRITR